MPSYELVGVPEAEVMGFDSQTADILQRVDLDDLRAQLTEIRDALKPVLDEDEAEGGRMRLDEIKVGLTLGASGRIMFIAKGSVEATITMTFSARQ